MQVRRARACLALLVATAAALAVDACSAFDDATLPPPPADAGTASADAEAGASVDDVVVPPAGAALHVRNITRVGIGPCRGKQKLRVYFLVACENAVVETLDAGVTCSVAAVACGSGGRDIPSAVRTVEIDLPADGSDDPFDVEVPALDPALAGERGVRVAIGFYASITRVLPRVLSRADLAAGATLDAADHPLPVGDLNANGAINTGDVSLAKSGSCEVADVNCDGAIDAIDIQLVKDSSGQVGDPCVCPP